MNILEFVFLSYGIISATFACLVALFYVLLATVGLIEWIQTILRPDLFGGRE